MNMNQCITRSDSLGAALGAFAVAVVVLLGGLAAQEILRWLRNRAYRRARGQR